VHDLVIRGGTLVTPQALRQADLAIADGLIAAVGPELPGARETIDARGLFVCPAVIDAHVHFNEPGRTDWEGAATGSRALAAGGGALFFDMPLNSSPCTVGHREFHQKCEALARASITDFALWGGIVPGNRDALAELAACGVIGFKAFMTDSGLPEFPRTDDLSLYEGMREAARLGLPVAVHAESEELIRKLTAQCAAQGRSGIRDYLNSRPVLAELEAIQRATLMAGETGAKLHIVHVSSGKGVLLAAQARARGVDISIETCPHYLSFTEEDLVALGAIVKCAPPLRSAPVQVSLWTTLLDGVIDIVASDHSPAPPAMKESADFFKVWGGIAGVQCTLPILIEEAHHRRGVPLTDIARLTATTPARRFQIPNRGALEIGAQADLTLINLHAAFTLQPEDLQQKHRTSPYIGKTFHCRIDRTLLRGQTIYHSGQIEAETFGRLVRPISINERASALHQSPTPGPRSLAPAAEAPIPAVHSPSPVSRLLASGASSRSARHSDHLLQTPDTFIRAPFPGMRKATAIVHVSPAIGARFTQYTAEFEPGGVFPNDSPAQRFVYLIEGELTISASGEEHQLLPGGYCYLAPLHPACLEARVRSRAAVIEKSYQALPPALANKPPNILIGHESHLASAPLMGDEAISVRLLLPDDPAFDFAVNTLTFQSGAALPIVEIHVMEHGLLMLAGDGIYRLGESWNPVSAGDFIWMAPFCPQWFGALGKGPAKYLLYKNWNRHPLPRASEFEP
jgi:allantoinase